MEDGQVVIQLLLCAFTSGWQHLGWNWDFVSPEVFLWHLYEHLVSPIAAPIAILAVPLAINPTTHSPNCPPLTPGSQLHSSSDGETLMRNIWSVFRFHVSAEGAAKWNLASLLGIHLERVVSSRGTNLHTLSTLLQRRAFMFFLLSMNLSRLHWFIGWPGSAPQSLRPPKVLPFLYKSKGE